MVVLIYHQFVIAVQVYKHIGEKKKKSYILFKGFISCTILEIRYQSINHILLRGISYSSVVLRFSRSALLSQFHFSFSCKLKKINHIN